MKAIVQKKGDAELRNLFLYKNESGSLSPLYKKVPRRLSNLKIADSLKEIFLPRGYPHTVSSDYVEYQIWDSIQAFSSNLSGALSLHSTLEALGIGKGNASTLAATLTWLLKDGVGMIASIVFAYWNGSEFDGNNKQWRMFADLSLDVTNLIKLLGPLLPIPILVTLCFSSIMLALVGVAGAATRVSLITHQAKCNNAADVSAKDGSQETMINLFGLITSLTLLPFVNANLMFTWTTFIVLVLIHVYANYKAMKSLKFNTLNRPRLLHIFKQWTSFHIIPDVASTNKLEPLLYGPAFQSYFLNENLQAKLGCSFDDVINSCPKFLKQIPMLFERQIQSSHPEKYILYYDASQQKIYVFFSDEAETEDYLLSFWASYLLSINHPKSRSDNVDHFLIKQEGPPELYVKEICSLARSTFKDLLVNLSEEGWTLDPFRLNIDEWRFEMKTVEDFGTI